MYSGSLVSVVEIGADHLSNRTGWVGGAAPFQLPGEPSSLFQDSSRERSSRYLSPRVDAALYDYGVRRWKRVNESLVELLELPRLDITARPATYLLVVHSRLARGREIDFIQEQVRVTTDQILSCLGVTHRGRRFHLVAAVTSTSLSPYPLTARESPSSRQYDEGRALAAWQIANLRSDQPAEGELERLRDVGNLLEPTGDMTLILHHDGAGLVLVDTVDNDVDSFTAWFEGKSPEDSVSAQVQWHLHTTLADCILLGLLQRAGLNSLADRVASAAAQKPDVETMLKMQDEFGRFKASVWWRHVSEEETVNLVLRAFQTRHGLSDLLEEVARDLGEYAAQVQALSAALSSAAVTILTLTLFPLTVIVALVAALTPVSASFPIKVLAYLSSIPISLGFGLGVASIIPDYLPFLRSTLRSRRGSG